MRREIKYLGRTIAITYKNSGNNEGLNFITDPKNPIQVAFHNYQTKRETNTHKSGVRKQIKISEFHKVIYMINGIATIYLMKNGKTIIKKVRLNQDDCIIIMNTFHKVVFNKGANAIEIKQGPYESDT